MSLTLVCHKEVEKVMRMSKIMAKTGRVEMDPEKAKRGMRVEDREAHRMIKRME
jgi:hypothetical protein